MEFHFGLEGVDPEGTAFPDGGVTVQADSLDAAIGLATAHATVRFQRIVQQTTEGGVDWERIGV